jgi:hypothetical protein
MLRSKLSYALCAAAVIALSLAAQAWAQEGGGGVVITIPAGGAGGASGSTTQPGGVVITPEGPGGHGQWDPETMKKRFEEFRKQMSQQMQKDMGATDEEWKVLEPKIQKLTELSMKTRGGAMGGRFFRIGMGGADNEKPTAVETASDDLKKVLADKNATPDQVKKALATYRDARDKSKQDAKQELEKAQKDLREILTQRQEAYLVTRGLLD